MPVPDFNKLREHIEHIQAKRDRVIIKTLYLGAFRESEICQKVCPSDKGSKPYGQYMTWKLEDFRINNRVKHKALVITAATAKKKPKTAEQKEMGFVPKTIALPVMPQYEPFTEELLKWLLTYRTLSFPLTRRSIYRIVRRNLKDLDSKVKAHSLRHWRITHLVDKYQFKPPDLTAYAGWTVVQSFSALGIRANPMMDIYYHSSWQQYFPKLLVPINDLKT
jgi:integrase